MSLMGQYIGKSVKELEEELLRLVKKYNDLMNKFLIIYAGAISKSSLNLPIGLEMEDYYVICDLLEGVSSKHLDFYIETPGGNATAAEEIAEHLHKHFEKISFMVLGEAKSAGTILVLSGDEILMSETGSLGPIDAQLKIGRITISAIDYIDWVEKRRNEAEDRGKLNPFDAMTVAQISPGELECVFNALEYAKDLVKKWLPIYKFKNWTITETRKKKVSEEDRVKRAEEIADILTDRGKWRTHGRSVKIEDFNGLLKIKKIEDNPGISSILKKIQTVVRLLFLNSNIYKIFATEREKLFKTAIQKEKRQIIPNQKPDVVEIEVDCPKCGASHRFYGKFVDNPKIDKDLKNKGYLPIPKDKLMKCVCGFEQNMSGIINNMELQIGRKIIIK